MNSDLADSSIGFRTVHPNYSAMERLNKFKSIDQNCIAKRVIKEEHQEVENVINLPEIYNLGFIAYSRNERIPPKPRSHI